MQRKVQIRPINIVYVPGVLHLTRMVFVWDGIICSASLQDIVVGYLIVPVSTALVYLLLLLLLLLLCAIIYLKT